MNRTFALPKPPSSRRRAAASPSSTPLRRRVAASPAVTNVDAAVAEAPVAEAPVCVTAEGSTIETSVDWSHIDPSTIDWATIGRAPVDWAAVDWAAIDWAGADWAAIDWAGADGAGADGAGAASSHGRAPATHLPAQQTSPTGRIPITLHSINESVPGPRWQALFNATWPAYRAWYLKEGDAARPDLETATAMLARHMPELVPTYERLVGLTGGDEVAARMLTMWDTPAFLPSCSQAVVTEPSPVLCRNYDYSPDLWEQTVYSSAFTGRKVIGTGDCLWGLLDGMNDAGLVVSLTFGGRPGSGVGFAIPLVVRYLLEVAENAAQARDLLTGLPVAMSYNLTVVDAAGAGFTAFVAPDAEPEFFDDLLATNHRGTVPEFAERAASLRSVQRQQRLTELVASKPAPNELAAAFHEAPLYNTEYARAFGTLYTALYLPAEGVVEYCWPDRTWRRTFDDVSGTLDIVLSGN